MKVQLLHKSLKLDSQRCVLLSMSIVVYIPLVGLFRVARFDEQGNAKAYTLWNERQELAPRFFFCMG